MKGLKNGGGVWDAREIYRRRDRTKYGSVSERCTASKGPELAPSHFVSRAGSGACVALRPFATAAEQKKIYTQNTHSILPILGPSLHCNANKETI